MKTISITISPNGESKVETQGFAGSECREASRFLESALGTQRSETLTCEYYGNQSQPQNEKQQER
ncbi:MULTISPECIES: DUF2997 domain-containing protein [Rhodopirellula]|uniref:DUF2997 domain-containing protein n=1 Tax=Rhodopirellula TaxID=265488 RepID=UPI002580C8E0|nr:DUF2997 domain-containing protein [Rhodopirellula sp. UBA1907]